MKITQIINKENALLAVTDLPNSAGGFHALKFNYNLIENPVSFTIYGQTDSFTMVDNLDKLTTCKLLETFVNAKRKIHAHVRNRAMKQYKQVKFDYEFDILKNI
jgi:hypothetical protein